MRRLLFLSSLLAIVFFTLPSCKARKKKLEQARMEEEAKNAKLEAADVEEEVLDEEVKVIRQPGVENPERLDSIKAELRKLKRKE